MSLQWRDGLSVDNDVIDADHKSLIEIANRVEMSLGTDDRQQLTDALANLCTYAADHFAREERIASAGGYAQLPALNRSREALTKSLEQLQAQIGQERTTHAVDRFVARLRSWLVDHVIKEDLLLKPLPGKFPRDFDRQ